MFSVDGSWPMVIAMVTVHGTVTPGENFYVHSQTITPPAGAEVEVDEVTLNSISVIDESGNEVAYHIGPQQKAQLEQYIADKLNNNEMVCDELFDAYERGGGDDRYYDESINKIARSIIVEDNRLI